MSGKFEKGWKGGPGRPEGDRGPYLKPALRKYMLSDVEEDFKPKTRVDELAIALGALAKQGNQKAIETIRYSLDGAEVKQFDINTLAPERLLELYHGLPDDDSEEAD